MAFALALLFNVALFDLIYMKYGFEEEDSMKTFMSESINIVI